MAGQPKRRAREADALAKAHAAGVAQGATHNGASVAAQTIAGTLRADGAPFFAPRSRFPGLAALGGGARVSKAALPPVTAYDPPAVVVAATAPVASSPTPEPPRAGPPAPEPPRAPDAARAPSPPPATPFAEIAPPPFAAASANQYAERYNRRQEERWAKSRDVPQPHTNLVHAWTLALSQFPPTALTIWIKRTEPAAAAYEDYLSGEELFDPMYPDRKLYDVLRRHRRQPSIAETFVGQIRGVSETGAVYDCGYGEIHLPPEPPAPPGAPWAPPGAMGAPWAAPSAPPPYGPPPGAYGYPPAPWAAPPWAGGPWGGPAPWWAQAQAPPAAGTAPPPPAHAAVDPVLLDTWRQAFQAASDQTRGSAESQMALVRLLVEHSLKPAPAAPAAVGGGFRETVSTLKDLASLLDTVRGSGNGGAQGGAGITFHKVGEDMIVTDKNGDIDMQTTVGLGVKSAVTDLAKGFRAMRLARAPGVASAAPPNGAPVATGLPTLGGGGSRVAKGPPPDANGSPAT